METQLSNRFRTVRSSFQEDFAGNVTTGCGSKQTRVVRFAGPVCTGQFPAQAPLADGLTSNGADAPCGLVAAEPIDNIFKGDFAHTGTILEPLVTMRNPNAVEPKVTLDPETIERMRQSQEALKRFAQYLNDALDTIDECPKDRGRQSWLGTKLNVSQKAARKWLKGEAFPEPVRAKDFRKIRIDLEDVRKRAWAGPAAPQQTGATHLVTGELPASYQITRPLDSKRIEVDGETLLRMIDLMHRAFTVAGRIPDMREVVRAALRAYPLWESRTFEDAEFINHYADFILS